MKVICIEKYDARRHNFKVDSKNSWLNRKMDLEQAKKEKANLYINDQLHYVVGQHEIGFAFLDVRTIPLYIADDQQPEYVYQIDLLVEGMVYKVQLSKEVYRSQKWLASLRTRNLLLISDAQYKKIILNIEPRDTNAIFFKTVGLHKINNQYFYVGSDCAISKDGRCDEVMALQAGFHLNYDEKRDVAEVAKRVIQYNSMNLRVFYPFHCIAVMSVLSFFLNEMGKRAGMVLWVDGEVASGKTELAVTLGNFFACGDSRRDMISHLHTTKMRFRDAEEELIKYQNGIFVLDDIKREESQGNKDTTKRITDLVVRSVYMGKVNNASINVMAIVTGEYFKEQMSTASRLIYLNVGNFIQDDENSEAFACIQEDKDYFNHFMCSFIAWLLKKTDSEAYRVELKDRFTRSHYEAEKAIYDFQRKLRPRMIEICSLLFFSMDIMREYLSDSLDEKERDRVQSFYEEGKEVAIRIVLETWLKSLDYQPILGMAFNNIMRKLKIKDCRYGTDFLNAEEGGLSLMFAKLRGNDGISVSERISSKEKMWLLKLDNDCAGILLNMGKEDILLMNKEIICEEIREEVRAQKDNWHIVYYESDYTDEKILVGLLNEHRLLAHKRSDNAFDKIISYPEIAYDDESGEIGIPNKRKVQMVRVYIDDEQKVLKYFDELKKEELGAWSRVREKMRSNRGGGAEVVELNKALNALNNFLDLK